MVHCGGGEALAQAAQRSCGCLLSGRVQGQVGGGLEHPRLVEGIPAHDMGGWTWMTCKAPSNPDHPMVP